MPSTTLFKNDKFVFERWRRNALWYVSSQAFVEGELKGIKESKGNVPNDSEDKRGGNLFTFMRRIYSITMIIGFILVALHIAFIFVF
jgi:hypothetical protein